MKKKGFTLIELLAVIVILALIALIAVPLVLNVIEESKRGAARESATNYVKQVESALVKTLMDGNGIVTTGLYTLGENGNIISPITLEIPMKGDKAREGSVCVGEKGAVISYSLKINNYYVKSNDGVNQEITEEMAVLDCKKQVEQNQVYVDGTEIYFNPETNKKCSEKEYQENKIANGLSEPTGLKTGCMKWYTFNDTEDAKQVNMILNHNIDGKRFATAMHGDAFMNESYQMLSEGTATWVSGLDPRFITADEITEITTDNVSVDSVNNGNGFYFDGFNKPNRYAWLFDCTYNCVSYGCSENSTYRYSAFNSVVNYYITSTLLSKDTDYVWIVKNIGEITPKNVHTSSPPISLIRPVITVSKKTIS